MQKHQAQGPHALLCTIIKRDSVSSQKQLWLKFVNGKIISLRWFTKIYKTKYFVQVLKGFARFYDSLNVSNFTLLEYFQIICSLRLCQFLAWLSDVMSWAYDIFTCVMQYALACLTRGRNFRRRNFRRRNFRWTEFSPNGIFAVGFFAERHFRQTLRHDDFKS